MKLLYKELTLSAHPSSIVFAFLGCLVFVPAYPYTVIFMFGCLAAYLTFLNSRETNDTWYTSILPVTKKEIVKGKFLVTVFFQLFQLIFSVPFVIMRNLIGIENNPVGIDATVAWYGFGLIIYSVFDLIFLTTFYKSGYKVGKAFIIASIPMVGLMCLCEACVHFPALNWLDSYNTQDIIRQIPIFIVGIIFYCICLALAYRISVNRFEKVNL